MRVKTPVHVESLRYSKRLGNSERAFVRHKVCYTTTGTASLVLKHYFVGLYSCWGFTTTLAWPGCKLLSISVPCCVISLGDYILGFVLLKRLVCLSVSVI